jgi:hypothetical protein
MPNDTVANSRAIQADFSALQTVWRREWGSNSRYELDEILQDDMLSGEWKEGQR